MIVDLERFSHLKGKTVAVGMSGGVDSSVSALLLKEAGCKVMGLFMKNWEEVDPLTGRCQSAKDFEDVAETCSILGIPFQAVNFVKEYQDKVFADFLQALKKGHTPNPDMLCNREIKFDVFLKKAMSLGAEYLATGHYCQLDSSSQLLKGFDPKKDQSYFLAAVHGDSLKNVVFPIGHLIKKQVREFAQAYQLPVHDKRDSTGICFIGERNFRNFLQNYIPYTPGNFCTLSGDVVGKHVGVAYYTIGQRRFLGLGGEGERWFVIKKDIVHNIVYVERGEHPLLFTSRLKAVDPHWLYGEKSLTFPEKIHAKIRYRQEDQSCTVQKVDNTLDVLFDAPQRGVTPGQSIVFYRGDVCLGNAIISE